MLEALPPGGTADPADPAQRSGSGPSWVGIGAQRCGTTWFTDLLCQHPQVGLTHDGRKEKHHFDRFLVDRWSDAERERYRALFPADVASGEFTPAYLRSLWVAPLLRAACDAETRLVVILRDPVERFRSALRWAIARGQVPRPADLRGRRQVIRRLGAQAIWAGMYATQLDVWARHFSRDRMIVLLYERVLADPVAAVVAAWKSLGLGPAPIDVARPATWNSTAGTTWTDPPGLAEDLRRTYRPEVDRLRDTWGLDTGAWPHFA